MAKSDVITCEIESIGVLENEVELFFLTEFFFFFNINKVEKCFEDA